MFTTRGNEWIACLTIAAILELYTAFRIPQEEEKNFPNRICFPIGKTELWSTRQQSAGCRIIILNE